MSQFLGLDIDKYVIEPLMSLLFILNTCQVESKESTQSVQYSFLKFDEFLAENIHSRLVHFHKTRCFRFRSYLLKIFLWLNEEKLQLPKMVLTEEMNKDYKNFMNFLMLELYSALF